MTLKPGSTLFLRIVIGLVCIVALLALILLPQLEGRAQNLDLFAIYLDPLIIYTFVGSLPFFFAIYRCFGLLSLIDRCEFLSSEAIDCVRVIKYCAYIFSGFIIIGIIWIRFLVVGEDPAGPSGLGLLLIFVSLIIATAAAVFERILKHAVEIKTENDLTV